MRYEFTDHEWVAIKLMLPNKPRCLHRSQQETVRGPVAKRAAPRRIDQIPHAMFARDNGGGIALLLLTPDRRGRTFVAMTTGASSLLADSKKLSRLLVGSRSSSRNCSLF